jgi:hypothetical protein
MTPPRPSKRPGSAAPGIKILISAAALASTIGGWALFTFKQEAATLATPPSLALELAPLPTLVARSSMPEVAAVGQSAAAPAPALRRVSAPAFSSAPAPVTVTRSSR